MEIPTDLKRLFKPSRDGSELPASKPNYNYPNPKRHNPVPLNHRFYVKVDDSNISSVLVQQNEEFVKVIENIKKRHDSVVTTIVSQKIFNIVG